MTSTVLHVLDGHPWWWYLVATIAWPVAVAAALAVVFVIGYGLWDMAERPSFKQVAAVLLGFSFVVSCMIFAGYSCEPAHAATRYLRSDTYIERWWWHGPVFNWTLVRPDSSPSFPRAATNALHITVKRGTAYIQVRWQTDFMQDTTMFATDPVRMRGPSKEVLPVVSAMPYFSIKAWSPDSAVVVIDPVQANR